MQEPIATLFSSQSIELKKTIHEAEAGDDDVMVSFTNFQFTPKEEDIPNELIINFDHEISKLHKVAREHHELFVKQVSEMKVALKLQVNELRTLMAKEVKKLDNNYNLMHKKVDLITNATTLLIEYTTSFNKEYSKDHKVKTEKEDKSSNKEDLVQILNLVLWQPTNSPHSMNFLQGGDIVVGVGSSKGSGEDT
ncbi:unnamed protein product [Lactuca saligna]|uniref:Uncharacterized protein n=1 Tax=Lactuca saligna TaxID=75948 RepID=A0AA36EPN2_LACSI|nr:unnamed protein product [Lactuca saligna]